MRRLLILLKLGVSLEWDTRREEVSIIEFNGCGCSNDVCTCTVMGVMEPFEQCFAVCRPTADVQAGGIYVITHASGHRKWHVPTSTSLHSFLHACC